jgi:hypothetical protein
MGYQGEKVMPTYEVTSPDGRTFEVTAPEGASQADVLAYAQQNFKPAEPSAPTKPKTLMQSGRDLLAGGVRGAGSIGATILAPYDIAKDALAGKGLTLESNRQRRSDMDGALGELGADTNSTAFGLGKIGLEIAGTAGAGGVLANGVRAAGATRAMAGLEPIVNGVARGLETGGFRVGDLAGSSAAIPARILTGAATGAATAGMVNPSDAGLGALIGGAIPGAVATAGKAGNAAGNMMRGPTAPTSETLKTAGRSMDAGYIIPPSMVNPSFKNRAIESLSGKFETAQMAATKNQQTTDDLVRRALNLPKDAPLSQEAMQAVRKQAGQVYEQIKGTGTVAADGAYINALDDIGKTIKSATASFPKLGKTNMHGAPVDDITELVQGLKVGQFDAGGAVDTISVLRDNADSAFRAGNTALGRANKAGAKALEDMLDRHLQQIGATDMLPAYRNARQLIAKTYTVEKGLREGAGTVDARALGRELQKKKPLSGELRTIAEFGNTFNKAAQPPHLIGSPGVSVLKPLLSGGMGAVAGGPVGMGLGVATNYVLPPLTRSLMFSRPYQQGLLNAPTQMLDEATQMGLLTRGALTAPVLSAR